MSWRLERADASSARAASMAMVKAMKGIRWSFIIGVGASAGLVFESM